MVTANVIVYFISLDLINFLNQYPVEINGEVVLTEVTVVLFMLL